MAILTRSSVREAAGWRFTGRRCAIAMAGVIAVVTLVANPSYAGPRNPTPSPAPPGAATSSNGISATITHCGQTGCVTPKSSNITCSGGVCMQVLGVGTHAQEWWMQATLPFDMCTYGTFWFPFSNISTFGPDLCGVKGDLYTAFWYDVYFNSSSWAQQACNTALQIGGKPCVWIFP
jgi:hypothetical protein